VSQSLRARFDALAATPAAAPADLDALWSDLAFGGPLDADPLVCRAEDGTLYAETTAAGGGSASLWAVAFRGEVTATMVYDALPVLDHFKAVDDDTLMGIMNGKLEQVFGTADPYYFWLERDL